MSNARSPEPIPANYGCIDLQDFADTRITEGGEFNVSRYLHDDFYMQLGSSVLEVASLSTGERDLSSKWSIDNPSIFAVRHVTSEGYIGEPLIIANEDFEEKGLSELHPDNDDHDMVVAVPRLVVIGSETTPELELNDDVEPEHAQMRIGISGGLNILDINGGSQTKLWFSEIDLSHPPSETRRFRLVGDPPEPITIEAIKGAWNRR